jgi:hypothetical protein
MFLAPFLIETNCWRRDDSMTQDLYETSRTEAWQNTAAVASAQGELGLASGAEPRA